MEVKHRKTGVIGPGQRTRRYVRYPGIRGRVNDAGGGIDFEIFEVRDGNALIWAERSHPELPGSASGGFGWVEPVGLISAGGEFDPAKVRHSVERRLRASLPQLRSERSAA